MKIAKLNGLNPSIWLADPLHRYVGRRVYLRNGKYAGQEWPASLLHNPFRAGQPDPLGNFEEYLRKALAVNQLIADEFNSLTDDMTLGCWCCDFDGAGEPPTVCHAAVIVRVWRERNQQR